MPRAKTTKRLLVQYVHSSIGNAQCQKRTVRALGLRRLGDVAEHDDTPALRGMLFAVRHLVRVEEVDA